jgi:hypothetical protein
MTTPTEQMPGQLTLPGMRVSPEIEHGPHLPARADLDAATAATAAAIADPSATRAEVERLAEAEAATYDACPDYPSLYDPEAEAEAEI